MKVIYNDDIDVNETTFGSLISKIIPRIIEGIFVENQLSTDSCDQTRILEFSSSNPTR